MPKYKNKKKIQTLKKDIYIIPSRFFANKKNKL
jgi:hypothetical protein